MKRLIRPTVRLRLTLLYGALFVVAGLVLLTVSYALLERALDPRRRPPGIGGPAGERPGRNPIGAIVLSDGRTIEELLAEARREEREEALRLALTRSGLALLLTSIGALALGWLVAGRVLSPVRAITAHARRASEATLGERIDLRGPPDELKELADTFDAMLGRLQTAFDSQRWFAARASHELRTPLTIVRAEADVALAAPDATPRERRLAEAAGAAADRGERLVDALLALARSESTLVDRATLDLAELTGDVVGELTARADAAGVTLDLDLASAIVAGDRALLGRLIGNLVENAIAYNLPGGSVQVAVATDGADVLLRVLNSGPVVPADQIAALFAPFQRGPAADRPAGHGLGLAIARAVAAAHGGTITATPRSAGGLEVVARLPTARSD